MDSTNILSIQDRLAGNSYPGRGLLLGLTPDGERLQMAYFLMGRSVNSRNREFVKDGEDLMTRALDPAKMEDPSLIIYHPLRVENKEDGRQVLIVGNGDQVDTVWEWPDEGDLETRFREALSTRTYEPDAPNYTPRITGAVELVPGQIPEFYISILRHGPEGEDDRAFFAGEAVPGVGFLIHTYDGDGDPIPTFSGEPREVALPDDAEALADLIWDSLDEENRITLYVRETNLATGETREFFRS